MKKEVLVAVFLGISLGLLITYGIYNANQALIKNKMANQPSAGPAVNLPNPSGSANLLLTVNSPLDNLLLDSNEATVSGQTEPKAVVAVIGEVNEELVEADNQGLFSTQIKLILGINQIKIISLNKTGQRAEQNLNVVYSTAKIE